jgi:hypothetical protein
VRSIILAAVLAATAAGPRVKIRVSPATVMKNGNTNLYCTVPRNAENRLLEYGVTDFRPGSQRDLDGERAAITWGPILIEHVPCDAGPAYCAVRDQYGRWTRAEQPINVAGCEEGTEP